MDNKIELAFHRLNRAKEELIASDMLYNGNLFKSANNRAYYAIFHAMRAVLAIECIDFKRHKDVIAENNKTVA